ncbi:hypothetical protein RHMOL_Rhmol13G0271200 [Rhododendron molle]|uniref:Uncharacterized protein n=1 Tax=Rhododendron molle TaxID=49168 RepID=A0ACC0LBM7_RHOML|nr:hypothetical protein RHMOL_Rhmol13G0271200 [Rhododendron molle]
MESDVFVANPLNDMYAESGNSSEASIVIHILNTRNVVSWNAMIADFARSSLEHAAAGLVGQISSSWTEIERYPGKCSTHKILKKKPNKGSENAKLITKTGS